MTNENSVLRAISGTECYSVMAAIESPSTGHDKRRRLLHRLNELDGRMFAIGGHDEARASIEDFFHRLLDTGSPRIKRAVRDVHPD